MMRQPLSTGIPSGEELLFFVSAFFFGGGTDTCGVLPQMYNLTMYDVLFIWAFIGMYNLALFG